MSRFIIDRKVCQSHEQAWNGYLSWAKAKSSTLSKSQNPLVMLNYKILKFIKKIFMSSCNAVRFSNQINLSYKIIKQLRDKPAASLTESEKLFIKSTLKNLNEIERVFGRTLVFKSMKNAVEKIRGHGIESEIKILVRQTRQIPKLNITKKAIPDFEFINEMNDRTKHGLENRIGECVGSEKRFMEDNQLFLTQYISGLSQLKLKFNGKSIDESFYKNLGALYTQFIALQREISDVYEDTDLYQYVVNELE